MNLVLLLSVAIALGDWFMPLSFFTGGRHCSAAIGVVKITAKPINGYYRSKFRKGFD
jgi:hypothetical protein